MNPLCQTVMRYLEAGVPLVLATMLDQQGSAPRTAGARMLVLPDGAILGSVGGGRYEAEAIAVAKELHRQGRLLSCSAPLRPGAILAYSLRGVTDRDMICGGSLTLLLEYLPNSIPGALSVGDGFAGTHSAASPVEAAECRPDESPVQAVFAVGREAENAGAPFVLITRILRDAAEHPFWDRDAASSPGGAEADRMYAATVERFVWLPGSGGLAPDGAAVPEQVLAEALALRSDVPRRFALEDEEYLLEFFPGPFRLVLFGAGHVSCETARLAGNVGFSTVVVDDRPEFASAARFPASAREILPSLSEKDCAALLGRLKITPSDGLIIVTRGHAHDRDALAAALETRAGYIGMIGSKSKRSAVYATLREKGVTEERLAAVYSPIGLDIGAETPAEIAVSIMAELIRWRSAARNATCGSGEQA